MDEYQLRILRAQLALEQARPSGMDTLTSLQDRPNALWAMPGLQERIAALIQRAQFNASGGRDRYGTNVEGRVAYPFEVGRGATLTPYMQGGAYFPNKGVKSYGGEVGAQLMVPFR